MTLSLFNLWILKGKEEDSNRGLTFSWKFLRGKEMMFCPTSHALGRSSPSAPFLSLYPSFSPLLCPTLPVLYSSSLLFSQLFFPVLSLLPCSCPLFSLFSVDLEKMKHKKLNTWSVLTFWTTKGNKKSWIERKWKIVCLHRCPRCCSRCIFFPLQEENETPFHVVRIAFLFESYFLLVVFTQQTLFSSHEEEEDLSLAGKIR